LGSLPWSQSLNEITLFMKTFEKLCQDVDNLVTSVGVSLSHQVYRYHFLVDFVTVLFLIFTGTEFNHITILNSCEFHGIHRFSLDGS
jgi:hypothetical protein